MLPIPSSWKDGLREAQVESRARPLHHREVPYSTEDDPSSILVCPYNQGHIISKARYPYHVLKCRKKHRACHPVSQHFQICFFNARHEMPVNDYEEHLRHCPDVLHRRDEIMFQRPSRGGNITSPKPTQISCVFEDWERSGKLQQEQLLREQQLQQKYQHGRKMFQETLEAGGIQFVPDNANS